MCNQYTPIPNATRKKCPGIGLLEGQYGPIQISSQEPIPLSPGGCPQQVAVPWQVGWRGRLRIRKMDVWLLLEAAHHTPQGDEMLLGGDKNSQSLADINWALISESNAVFIKWI